MSRDLADDDPMSPDSQDSSISDATYSTVTANPPIGRGAPLRPSLHLDQTTASPSPVTTEPLTREWNVPARPKPGRKPAQDTPVDKRRAQNRVAQRNFRERRNARVGELEIELTDIRKSYENTIATLTAQFAEEKDALQKEIFMWRARCEEHERQRTIEQEKARRQLEQSQCRWQGGISPVTTPGSNYQNGSYPHEGAFSQQNVKVPPLLPLPKISTDSIKHLSSSHRGSISLSHSNDIKSKDIKPLSPPEEHDAMEVDFTTQKTAPLSTMLREDEYNPATEIDNCGFCSDNTPCICRDNMIAAEKAEKAEETIRQRDFDGVNAQSIRPPLNKPTPIEPSLPGTCSDCMADPLRKQFCINLSAYSSSKPKASPLPRQASSTSRSNSYIRQPEPFQRISCADAYSRLRTEIPQFEKHVNDASLYRQLRPSPATPEGERNGSKMEGIEKKPNAAYELDAANVLATIASSKGGSYQGTP